MNESGSRDAAAALDQYSNPATAIKLIAFPIQFGRIGVTENTRSASATPGEHLGKLAIFKWARL